VNPGLVINGVNLPATCEDGKWWTWDFSIIRSMCSEAIENNNFVRLHENFLYNSMEARQYYDLPFEEFENSIFTSGLQIALKFEGPLPDKLDAQEEVWLSKMQKK
jgi:hypothetical protein